MLHWDLRSSDLNQRKGARRINLAIQSENSKDPLNESDRQRLIELISALQRYEEQQIEGNKK